MRVAMAVVGRCTCNSPSLAQAHPQLKSPTPTPTLLILPTLAARAERVKPKRFGGGLIFHVGLLPDVTTDPMLLFEAHVPRHELLGGHVAPTALPAAPVLGPVTMPVLAPVLAPAFEGELVLAQRCCRLGKLSHRPTPAAPVTAERSGPSLGSCRSIPRSVSHPHSSSFLATSMRP